MTRVQPCPLPAAALLATYADLGFVDCFTAQVERTVPHAEYVEAFYTGRVFRIERWLLKVFVARPSTDDDARRLASGEAGSFAAWRVESRAANQLLMCDFAGRTRSWLMTEDASDGAGTRLYFGSAVVASKRPASSKGGMGVAFGALLGFHKLYSRVLLGAARARLARDNPPS